MQGARIADPLAARQDKDVLNHILAAFEDGQNGQSEALVETRFLTGRVQLLDEGREEPVVDALPP